MAQGLGARSRRRVSRQASIWGGKRILVTAVMVDGKSWSQIEIELNTSSRIAAPPTIRRLHFIVTSPQKWLGANCSYLLPAGPGRFLRSWTGGGERESPRGSLQPELRRCYPDPS
jgi:hypothetical protein